MNQPVAGNLPESIVCQGVFIGILGLQLMKYYIYFDAYGHAAKIISAQKLAEKYDNAPEAFLAAMCRGRSGTSSGHITGHVGTLSFDSPKELQDYLADLSEDIAGFYGGRSECRPYNF